MTWWFSTVLNRTWRLLPAAPHHLPGPPEHRQVPCQAYGCVLQHSTTHCPPTAAHRHQGLELPAAGKHKETEEGRRISPARIQGGSPSCQLLHFSTSFTLTTNYYSALHMETENASTKHRTEALHHRIPLSAQTLPAAHSNMKGEAVPTLLLWAVFEWSDCNAARQTKLSGRCTKLPVASQVASLLVYNLPQVVHKARWLPALYQSRWQACVNLKAGLSSHCWGPLPNSYMSATWI